MLRERINIAAGARKPCSNINPNKLSASLPIAGAKPLKQGNAAVMLEKFARFQVEMSDTILRTDTRTSRSQSRDSCDKRAKDHRKRIVKVIDLEAFVADLDDTLQIKTDELTESRNICEIQKTEIERLSQLLAADDHKGSLALQALEQEQGRGDLKEAEKRDGSPASEIREDMSEAKQIEILQQQLYERDMQVEAYRADLVTRSAEVNRLQELVFEMLDKKPGDQKPGNSDTSMDESSDISQLSDEVEVLEGLLKIAHRVVDKMETDEGSFCDVFAAEETRKATNVESKETEIAIKLLQERAGREAAENKCRKLEQQLQQVLKDIKQQRVLAPISGTHTKTQRSPRIIRISPAKKPRFL